MACGEQYVVKLKTANSERVLQVCPIISQLMLHINTEEKQLQDQSGKLDSCGISALILFDLEAVLHYKTVPESCWNRPMKLQKQTQEAAQFWTDIGALKQTINYFAYFTNITIVS